MDSFSEYAKPLAVGHGGVQRMLVGSKTMLHQEKLDGSQISFVLDFGGQIFARSRSKPFDVDAPDSMFELAAASIKDRAHLLVPGWTYRGEYLNKPKHNVLRYNRTPRGSIAIFDIAKGLHDYIADPRAVENEANRIGLEYCRVFCVGPYDPRLLDLLLENESMLGGPRIEGVVLKDHSDGGWFGRDGKPIMAKYVSKEFKESMKQVWKPAKDLSVNAICADIARAVCPEARWRKVVQHLREAGQLVNAPNDIGPLLAEVASDVRSECTEEIKDMLWSRFNKEIMKQCSRGFAEWYKGELCADDDFTTATTPTEDSPK